MQISRLTSELTPGLISRLTSELTPGLISRLASAFNFGINFQVNFGDQG